MLFLLDVYEGIVVEILGGGEVLQYVYPVGDEAFSIEIIGQIDVFTLILDVLKQLIVVESGIVGAVEILSDTEGILSLF